MLMPGREEGDDMHRVSFQGVYVLHEYVFPHLHVFYVHMYFIYISYFNIHVLFIQIGAMLHPSLALCCSVCHLKPPHTGGSP